MTQKKQSNRHEGKLLAKREAPKIQKSSAKTKKRNLFNQINSNGESVFLSRCPQQKKKKLVPPVHSCKVSNNTAEQMDVDQEGAMGIHFPEGIIMDILSRLPVRSLQRFKCVSPLWKALISDRYFKMKHLNRAKNDLNSQKILAARHLAKSNYAVKFYRFSLSSVQVVEDEQTLDCPSNCKPACTIQCCCDGLVLLSTRDRLDKHMYLLLWNPSTRESIVLPSPEYRTGSCVFGLGYDTTSDDYKILVADLNAGCSDKVSVEIFALKSGSWRKIGKYPTGIDRVSGYINCGMYSLAFIHGAFHWLGKSACYTIVSFSISNEVYGEIPLLERMYNMCKFRLEHGVSVLRGMLCYYTTPNNYGLHRTFNFWVMKDYGVKESWTQLLAIRDTNDISTAIPQYMFADDEVLLRLKQLGRITSLYWTSKRGPFELWPEPFLSEGIVYTESLISPKLLI